MTDKLDLEETKEESSVGLNLDRLALLNILEDIEEAKKIIEEERRKLQMIIFNFVDGLLFFDNEKTLRIFNPQAEKFFELKAIGIINRNISELQKFSKLKVLLDFLNDKPEIISREELKIAENLILEVSTLSVFTEQKEKMGKLIVLHNITREKQVEKAKSEFVSIAAHQLRTPLSAIKWTLGMLLNNDLGKLTSEQKNFIEKTYKANERIVTIVSDLLDVTRIEEGRYIHQPTLVKIEDIIEEIIISNKELIQKKGLQLTFHKPEINPAQAKVDIEKIRLALQNLIENAIHYTPQQGKIVISVKYTNKEVEFHIQDTGIGIPKNQQHRLFTKFFRAPDAIKMETDGSGLGLFITKNIIEAHKGKIWFESEENKGSSFYFTLPLES
jgi:signal transduction histidine kinase